MEKPDLNQFFDQRIQEALRSKAGEIAPLPMQLDRINAEITKKEREYYTMNNKFKITRMKPVVIIALVFILSAATCFAATQITSLISTSSEAFDTFPTERQIENAVNYIPDYVEEFSNGFYFDSASVNDTAAMDHDNNQVAASKGITFFYKTDQSEKGQLMTLSTDPEMVAMDDDSGSNQEVLPGKNFDLIYSKVTFKLVPEGYVPTEEEKLLEEKGTLWISYGADETEVSDIQYVKWVKDGILYNLMEKGYGLEKDEILKMADEVIGADQ